MTNNSMDKIKIQYKTSLSWCKAHDRLLLTLPSNVLSLPTTSIERPLSRFLLSLG